MGWDCHLSVVFACNQNEGVAALAKTHLEQIPENHEPGTKEARWFLEGLSRRTGDNPGPKGGLSAWGMVGNYTDGAAFVEVLRPFWTDLLDDTKVDGGPHAFEHVIVFYEPEQSEHAQAFEIGREEDERGSCSGGSLFVKHHDNLPFAWMQF